MSEVHAPEDPEGQGKTPAQAPAQEDALAEARAKVASGEWEFIQACDCGSHMYCDPCMNPFYVSSENLHSGCVVCGTDADPESEK